MLDGILIKAFYLKAEKIIQCEKSVCCIYSIFRSARKKQSSLCISRALTLYIETSAIISTNLLRLTGRLFTTDLSYFIALIG